MTGLRVPGTTPAAVVEMVPVGRLTPARWNPRHFGNERFANLQRSLTDDPEYLRMRPILADARGVIYAGNMRYRAAVALGWDAVPAILEDVPEVVAKARAIVDNQQWGEWGENLGEFVYQLGDAGAELDLLGFADVEAIIGTVAETETERIESEKQRVILHYEASQEKIMRRLVRLGRKRTKTKDVSEMMLVTLRAAVAAADVS